MWSFWKQQLWELSTEGKAVSTRPSNLQPCILCRWCEPPSIFMVEVHMNMADLRYIFPGGWHAIHILSTGIPRFNWGSTPFCFAFKRVSNTICFVPELKVYNYPDCWGQGFCSLFLYCPSGSSHSKAQALLSDISAYLFLPRREHQVQSECWKPKKRRHQLSSAVVAYISILKKSTSSRLLQCISKFSEASNSICLRHVFCFPVASFLCISSFPKASNHFKEAGAFGRCNFCRLDSAIDTDCAAVRLHQINWFLKKVWQTGSGLD